MRAALGCMMLLILLMESGVSAAQVLNPSFEATTNVIGRGLLPQSWQRREDQARFNSYCSSSPALPSSWKTDGNMSAALFNLPNRFITRGNSQSFYQERVDLTGIGTIRFDVRLSVPVRYTGPFEHFEASFLVDGVARWKQTVGGEYRDQEVNVAGLGPRLFGHTIEVRITALDTGTFVTNYYTQWDNIRLIEGRLIIPAAVDLDPNTLNLASNGNWITCYIEPPEDKSSGKTYDVSKIDGASVTLQCGDNPTPILAYKGDQGWATAAANADNVADFDGDGVLERMVKFDRAAVQRLVQPPEATVTIQGDLPNGISTIGFKGTATIRVLDNKAKKE